MSAGRAARLVGLDVARCLALVGMVTTHVLDPRTPEGDLALGQWLAGGRSSALFALLAGVGLALLTGGRDPVRGTERAARSVGIVVRAALIAAVGLVLGGLESGLAVILVQYAVTFVLVVPFLAWRARTLLAAGAAWIVVGPVLLQVLRPGLAPRGVENPDVVMLLAEPGRVLTEVLFTGYYPAFVWVAYLLVGLGVGRLDLRRRSTALGLAVVGAVVAVAATVVSGLLVRTDAVAGRLLAEVPDPGGVDALLDQGATGMFGTTPAGGTWAWLLVVSPHSSTPFDLAQTTGSALLVLGLCLLATLALPDVGRRAAAIGFGAGGMTLSLYSLHVWLRTPTVWPSDGPDGYRAHVLVLLVLGAGFAALGLRGPLEALVRRAADGAGSVVRLLARPGP